MTTRAKFKVTQISTGRLHELREELKLDKRVINVGIPEGKTEKDGTPLAMIAAAHEFGVEENGIPERSFLRASNTKHRPQFVALNRANLIKVVRGEMTVTQALGQLGELAKGYVQAYIGSANLKPLKPATIKRKKSSRPLIDTGTLRQNVTWEFGEEGAA